MWDEHSVAAVAAAARLLFSPPGENDDSNVDSGKDLEGARREYQSALLDWSDDAREAGAVGDDGTGNEGVRETMVDLWIAYATLNIDANAPKLAKEAFEAGVNCEVAGSSGRLWGCYASWNQNRGKVRAAQTVYLRALSGDNPAVSVESNPVWNTKLWDDFLVMVRGNKNNPTLTLERLKEAVIKEGGTGDVSPALPPAMVDCPSPDATSRKRKIIEMTHVSQRLSEPANRKRTAADLAGEVDRIASLLQTRTSSVSPSAAAEWMAMDGDAIPSMPKGLFGPSPPRLVDASGKDILGREGALDLLGMLLRGSDFGDRSKNDGDVGASGAIILDVCRGCWAITALAERRSMAAREALDKKLMTDLEKLEDDLDARLEVAGGARSAVEEMNVAERREFLSSCKRRREDLHIYLCWEFRHLQSTQQEILTEAGVPGFKGATADDSVISCQIGICSFLHSAFYLRSRIGEDSHRRMLMSQEERLSSMVPDPPELPKVMTAPTIETNKCLAIGNIQVQSSRIPTVPVNPPPPPPFSALAPPPVPQPPPLPPPTYLVVNQPPPPPPPSHHHLHHHPSHQHQHNQIQQQTSYPNNVSHTTMPHPPPLPTPTLPPPHPPGYVQSTTTATVDVRNLPPPPPALVPNHPRNELPPPGQYYH